MELIVLANFASLPRELKPCITICATTYEAALKQFKYDHPGKVAERVYQCPTGKVYNFYFDSEVKP